jgi:uncharacterized protein (TIGR02147 family)
MLNVGCQSCTIKDMTRAGPKISIFRYLDYRVFLRDWYQTAKQSKSISLRAFSEKAGFTSPNYFKMVMDGDRNLSDDSIKKFSQALELNKQEQEFFLHLVHYTQAKNHEVKDVAYQSILQSRKFKELKPIEKEQYDFYSAWYHPVVRELIIAPDFKGSFEALGRKLSPAITAQQVKKSVELLEKLGFIKKDTKNHRWVQSTPVVTTGSESANHTLLNYHLEVLDLTKKVLEKIPQDKRDVSALTLGIARSRLPEIKNKIQAFRREILSLVADDNDPEQVVLLTMQLIPVTREDANA